LESDMFTGVSSAKTVIVKVPSGAAEYVPKGKSLPVTYAGSDSAVCWGNGFRGKGWNGNSFTGGANNSNITLRIQYE
jgi:hypothetical protein